MDRGAEPALVVGVDIGGTKVAATSIALRDAPVGRDDGGDRSERAGKVVRRPTPTSPGALLDAVSSAVTDAAADASDGQISAIGLGLAGFIDVEGVARQAPNVAALVDVDLAGALRDRFGVGVVVDNDANCAARAAWRVEAPDASHVVVVAIGTGIGGGLIVDGQLVRGAHGFAGEPGHMVIDPDGALCLCGQRGCWETRASGSALDRAARAVLGDGATGSDLFVSADAGEPGAEAGLAGYCRWVAIGVANLVNLLDPEIVLITGGIAQQGDSFGLRLEAALETLPTVRGGRDLCVRLVDGGHDAAALGAAMLAAESLGWDSGAFRRKRDGNLSFV